MKNTHKNNSSILRVILCLNILICASIIAIPILSPKGDKVAVITSPWGSSDEVMGIIANADGALVNAGRADWIAVATSDSKNFVSKLYQAGAILVIDGTIAAACL